MIFCEFRFVNQVGLENWASEMVWTNRKNDQKQFLLRKLLQNVQYDVENKLQLFIKVSLLSICNCNYLYVSI